HLRSARDAGRRSAREPRPVRRRVPPRGQRRARLRASRPRHRRAQTRGPRASGPLVPHRGLPPGRDGGGGRRLHRLPRPGVTVIMALVASVSCAWLAPLLLAGCHLIVGTDGLYVVDEEGSGGGAGGEDPVTATSAASSTTTTTTSATGGGGGGFQCTTADQCPIPEDPCYEPKCTLGNCEFIPSEAGARCGEGFCDGAGICVACV